MLQDEIFDVVISGQTFEHIEFFWLTMQEIKRILKQTGLCCIIAPSSGPEHKFPIDCWRFFPDGMKAIAKYAKLSIIEVYSVIEDLWNDTILICKKDI